MSKFYISGEIVQNKSAKCYEEDVCPSDFKDFVDGLEENEEIELDFSCLGGDVLGGLQICSMISDARKNGHKTIANVTSIAASMASVIACACDELNLYEGAFIMCHLPWTMAMGNSNDLKKEIATLEQMKKSMMNFYRTKFDLSDEEIDNMLAAETWIDSSNYQNYKLNCSIIPCSTPMKIAASIANKNFKNIPEVLKMENKAELPIEEEEKKEQTEETVVEQPSTDEPSTEETKTEEKVEEQEEEKVEEQRELDEDEPDVEELKKKIEELTQENEELKSRLAECEKEEKKAEEPEEEKKPDEDDEEVLNKAQVQARISGIQSSMQKQINDFKSQLKAKEEELKNAQADVTRLTASLEKTSKELSDMASAFEEKQQALEKLNANVNAKAEELPTMKDGLEKCSTPAERVAFLKSGKYTK